MEDGGTGLTYMKARYYDQVAMRFLSPDPVYVDLTTGGNFNRYWYVNNNPYTYVDPDGRQASCSNPANAVQCAAAGMGARQAATDAAARTVASATAKTAVRSVVANEIAESDSIDAGSSSVAPPDPESANEIDPAEDGELTRAGRAQQKHGDREINAFDPAKGSPGNKNAQGQRTLEEIMNSPDRVDEIHTKYGTDVCQVPDGRGARFGTDGKFIGFIQPRAF